MHQISSFLPGIAGARTFATWPVWRDSARDVRFVAAVSKRQAVRLYHKARRFERQTRQPGRQDGALGRNGLAVLHALLFDFLNYASGRLDPSYAGIADKACISPRSVARGLVKLRLAGVLNWLRRCREDHDAAGRFRLRQESNAYAVLPARQWRGFIEPRAAAGRAVAARRGAAAARRARGGSGRARRRRQHRGGDRHALGGQPARCRAGGARSVNYWTARPALKPEPGLKHEAATAPRTHSPSIKRRPAAGRGGCGAFMSRR